MHLFTMKHLLTIISCLLALNLAAQEVVVEYPYNPDFENDGNVGVEDLMQLLSSFGMGFDVEEINIDELTLSDWISLFNMVINEQQNQIDSLTDMGDSYSFVMDQILSMQNSMDSLQAELSELEASLPIIEESSNFYQAGFQCVDFGGSPDCPGDDFAQSVSTISDDNYKYPIRDIHYLNSQGEITLPLWRKFQITGLPADYDGKIKLRSIRWNYGSYGNNPIWQNHDWTFVPESSAEGLFFWTYWNTSNDWDDNDCQTSIFNLIPEEHSINAWLYQGTQEYEIWIEGEGAYFDTGIRFRMGIY